MLNTKISSIVLKHMKKKLINNTITEDDVAEVLKQIRIALLDADVSLIVVKNFIKNVKAKVVDKVIDSKTDPEQFLLSVIKKELTEILGKEQKPINIGKPTKIMMVGLQGSGKTTTAAKLSNYFKNKNAVKPLMVGLDIYRPGAIDQLKQLANEIKVDFYDHGTQNPRQTAIEALELAKNNGNDFIVFDTAGRLQTDEKLIQELIDLKKTINPTDILLVVDAMSGQDMINVAQEFNDKLNLTGIIITKLDSDAKAGVALSLASLLNVPIKMTGVGEKVGSIDLFYPERMADRILGLGDIMTLAEKASDVIDEDRGKKTIIRMLSGKMDLEDLLWQVQQMNKLGSLDSVMKMMPGTAKISESQINAAEEKMRVWKILMNSMTLKERRNPSLIRRSLSRRTRIIKGSGRKPDELNKMLNEFEQSKKKMDQIGSMLKKGKNPQSILKNFGN